MKSVRSFILHPKVQDRTLQRGGQRQVPEMPSGAARDRRRSIAVNTTTDVTATTPVARKS
jgi:hypothetical protein